MFNRVTALKLLICAIITLLFQGCSANSFDHAAYLKALLDASYKAEFGEYIELTQSDEAEARQQYDAGIDAVVDDICDALGVTVSEEGRGRLEDIMENVFKSVSYEVLSAEKVSGNQYDVELKIRPVLNFSNIDEELSVFAEEFITSIYSPELQDENPEYVYSLFVDGIIDVLEKETEKIEYGEEQSLRVPVMYDKTEKMWSVPSEWQDTVFDTMITL